MTTSDARFREMARRIFSSCVGITPRRLLAQAGGQTNHVYRVDTGQDSFILRMSEDEAKLEDFRKERWAIARALSVGVAAPEVLHVDRSNEGIPFMLARRTLGRPATRSLDRDDVLKQMGRHARTLHDTKLPTFGAKFHVDPAPRNDWDAFLDGEYRLDERLVALERAGLIAEAQAGRLREVMHRLGHDREPRLNHGDLRLKNVLVGAEGRISALIDWEFATAAPVPEWDLSVALHDLSIDEKDAFLEGYGMVDQELLALGPALAALNVLHYAPFVDAAEREGDAEQLRRFRRRFSRVYDLYSFD